MYLVAEVGPCEGDIDYAKACAEAIKEAAPFSGIMKGQWYSSETITRRGAARYDRTPGGPDTQGELFDTQLNWDEWFEVVEHCRSIGLPFFPTVFDFEAVERAAEMGIGTLKIASGDITHGPLVQYASSYTDHLVVSTGAANPDEVRQAQQWMGSTVGTFLACHLAYPSTWEQGNLGRINALRQVLYGGPNKYAIGYSDHTPQFRFMDMLVALEVVMWEKHFTLSKHGFEHGDHSFAIDENDLRIMEQSIEVSERYIGDRHLSPTEAEGAALEGARRSIVFAQGGRQGEAVTKEMLSWLRPADGVSAAETFSVLGKELRRDVEPGDLFAWEMVYGGEVTAWT